MVAVMPAFKTITTISCSTCSSTDQTRLHADYAAAKAFFEHQGWRSKDPTPEMERLRIARRWFCPSCATREGLL